MSANKDQVKGTIQKNIGIVQAIVGNANSAMTKN